MVSLRSLVLHDNRRVQGEVVHCCHRVASTTIQLEVREAECFPTLAAVGSHALDLKKTRKDHNLSYPCCGSGSTCFWASRIRIRIHWSEVWIRIRILLWIRILLLLCKNSKRNLDSYYFVILFEFLSLKNDVNVASKSHKQNKLC